MAEPTCFPFQLSDTASLKVNEVDPAGAVAPNLTHEFPLSTPFSVN